MLLCQMHDINIMSRGNTLAPNMRNSLPCTLRQCRVNKELVVCYVAWLESIIYGIGFKVYKIIHKKKYCGFNFVGIVIFNSSASLITATYRLHNNQKL